MKKLLLITFVCFTAALNAQTNYELFNSKSEFFYAGSPLDGLKPDSVKTSGSDSLYYHYRVVTLATNTTNCWNARGVSWLGKVTRRKPNNDYIFYTESGDSVLIKADAATNSPWKMYTYSNGNYIQANVISRQYEVTYNGMSDTVKTISLQAYSSSSVAISHSINAVTFKIARTQGLIKFVNIYSFPNTATSYYRCFGKRFLKGDLFDLNPGEILQTYTVNSSPSIYMQTYQTFTCTGKNVLPGSVTYSLNVYTYEQKNSAQGPTVTTNSTVQTKTISGPSNYLFLQMPKQFLPFPAAPNYSAGGQVDYYYIDAKGEDCGLSIKVHDCFSYIGTTDTCMGPSVSCSQNSWKVYHYKKGMFHNETQTGLNQINITSYPVYHSAASFTCGTYASVGLKENSINNQIVLYPNPVEDYFFVNVTDLHSWDALEIRDVTGRLYKRFGAESGRKLDVSELPSGVFLVNAMFGADRVVLKMVKK